MAVPVLDSVVHQVDQDLAQPFLHAHGPEGFGEIRLDTHLVPSGLDFQGSGHAACHAGQLHGPHFHIDALVGHFQELQHHLVHPGALLENLA